MSALLRVIPDLARLVARLVGDPVLPKAAKVVLGAAALYLLSPIDLIPDFVPLVGYLDDLLLAAVVIDGVLNWVDRALVQPRLARHGRAHRARARAVGPAPPQGPHLRRRAVSLRPG